MQVIVDWQRTLTMKKASHRNMIYEVDLAKLPVSAGVYVFGRKWGNSFEALYVGKASNIQARVKTQQNNLRLMQHIRNAKTGTRVLMYGTLKTKRGQQREKCLEIAERALIRFFLSEGDDLVNIQGTNIRRHELYSSGSPHRVLPWSIFVQA